MSMTGRLIAAVAVAASLRLFTRQPMTCVAAGRLGAAARKDRTRSPYRVKAANMYLAAGLPVPAALIDDGGAA